MSQHQLLLGQHAFNGPQYGSSFDFRGQANRVNDQDMVYSLHVQYDAALDGHGATHHSSAAAVGDHRQAVFVCQAHYCRDFGGGIGPYHDIG